MSPHKTLTPVKKSDNHSTKESVQKNLEKLLNNDVSKDTPFYDSINIFKHC